MIETQKLAIFLTASIILAATPGPGMLYVLSRTMAGGKREGIPSSLGTFLGGMMITSRPASTKAGQRRRRDCPGNVRRDL